MNINLKDVVTVRHASHTYNVFVIGLWKMDAANNEWDQLLCNTDSYKFGFAFDKNLVIGWTTSPRHLELVNDIDSYQGKLVEWIPPSLVTCVIVNEKTQNQKSSLIKNDFCVCKVCTEQAHMAEPNQADGTFICFSCRTYPIRQYY